VTGSTLPPLGPSLALRRRDPFAALGCFRACAQTAVKSASFLARHSFRIARHALPGPSAANDGARSLVIVRSAD